MEEEGDVDSPSQEFKIFSTGQIAIAKLARAIQGGQQDL